MWIDGGIWLDSGVWMDDDGTGRVLAVTDDTRRIPPKSVGAVAVPLTLIGTMLRNLASSVKYTTTSEDITAGSLSELQVVKETGDFDTSYIILDTRDYSPIEIYVMRWESGVITFDPVSFPLDIPAGALILKKNY